MVFVREQSGLTSSSESTVAAQNSWLYGGDPLQYLLYDEAIKTLREMAADKGFERLLKELLLEPDGVSLLHMLPSKTLSSARPEDKMARLRGDSLVSASISQRIFAASIFSRSCHVPIIFPKTNGAFFVSSSFSGIS